MRWAWSEGLLCGEFIRFFKCGWIKMVCVCAQPRF